MDVVAAADDLRDLLRSDHAALAVQQVYLHPRQCSNGTGFAAKGVIGVLHDNLIAWLRVHLDADLVCHGARGYEERRFLAEHVRGQFLQTVYRRVFAKDVIADFGLRHSPAHGWGGFGNRIAA